MIALMAAIAQQLKLADIHCFLLRTLNPFLVTEIIDITEPNLLEALKSPVSRSSFDKMMTGVFELLNGLENGTFDVEAARKRSDKILPATDEVNPFDAAFRIYLTNANFTKDEEDKFWVMRNFIKSATSAKKGKYSKQDEEPTQNSGTRMNMSYSVHLLTLAALTVHTLSVPLASSMVTNADFRKSSKAKSQSILVSKWK